MRVFYVLLASALLVFAAAALDAKAADSPCRPCPNGTTTVAVDFQSSDDQRHFYYWNGDELSYDPPAGMKRGGGYVIDSRAAFRSALIDAANRCERIGYLRVDSHGNLGRVIFENERLDLNGLDDVLGGLDCVMADNARIEFGGCLAGLGCRGEDFMAAIAGKLLRRGGGSVTANTTVATTLFGLTPNVADTQTIIVTPGLKAVTWQNSPRQASECRDRAQDALDDVKAMRRRVGSCPYASGYLEKLNTAQGELELAVQYQGIMADLREPRAGFDKSHEDAGRNFYNAFDLYYDLVDALKDVPACDSDGEPRLPSLSPGGGRMNQAF